MRKRLGISDAELAVEAATRKVLYWAGRLTRAREELRAAERRAGRAQPPTAAELDALLEGDNPDHDPDRLLDTSEGVTP